MGEFEIHLTAGGDSVAWWVALQDYDCLWPVPTVSDLTVRGAPDEASPSATEKLDLPSDSGRTTNAPVSLDQVHRGEVSVENYLYARVKDAIQHLDNRVSAEQMHVMKGLLWASLQSAPVVAELVRRAAAWPRSR